MKTHFHIENKEFTDYLKITANGNEYYFCDDLTIEYTDCERLDVNVEFISNEDYLKIKANNSFLKLLLNIVKWILAPLLYFIDNEYGIGFDKGYHSFNPFILKKSFSLDSLDEKTINISYVDSQYDKTTKKFTPPSVEIKGDNITQKAEEILFSTSILKREWNTYHIPAFTLIMVIILLLNWLNFSIFAKVIKETPLYPMSENLGGIVGMSFCSLAMVALFVVFIVAIVKSYRLYKNVKQQNL